MNLSRTVRDRGSRREMLGEEVLCRRVEGDLVPRLAEPVTFVVEEQVFVRQPALAQRRHDQDRKSTRLNSSHSSISYAVFCLKKKNTKHARSRRPKQTKTQAATPP